MNATIVIIFILNDPGAVGYLRDTSIFIIPLFTDFVNQKWICLTISYPATKNRFWHYAKSTMKAAGYIISGNFGMALIKKPKRNRCAEAQRSRFGGILEFEKFQQVDTNLLL